MQVPIRIIFRGVPHSDAVEAEIRRHAAKFEQFFDHISSLRFTIERASARHERAPLFDVSVDIRVPGEDIVVGHRHSREDLSLTVREACEAAEQRLQDYAHMHRGEAKAGSRRRRPNPVSA